MSDPLKEIDDSIYNDDTTLNTTGGTYDAYDPYQTDNQWLYNDTQTLQIPQGGESAGQCCQLCWRISSNDNAANGNDSNNNSSSNVPQTVSRNKDEGKLFVGGLSWETDENRLREYFSKYGTIIDCSIMRDQTTGRPRGFGFVTFENIDGVNAVLQEPTHTVDGKQIDPKHAIPRDNQVSQGRNNYSGGQQSHGGSVGNYNANSGGDGGYGNNNSNGGGRNSYEDPTKDMRGEKFGVITETKLMMDRETGRSRGYGFLQFETEDAAMQAVKIGNSGDGIMIHGKRVDVKPAVRKKPSPMMGGMPGAQGNSYGMMAGMPGYGMMGMGMMGMPGYSMMGMPGYGMMGAGGAASGMDYSAAMNYGGGYYGQMNMPGAYYGGAGADGSAIADGQGDGSGGKGGDQSGSGYYDQKQSGGTLRPHGRDSGGHRSSSRRYDGGGGRANDGGNMGGRSDRDRPRGDNSGNAGNSGSRTRDDYRVF
ncbi:hypothetical protein BX661DRAFT_180951 [Kickxella alabastrina]|uniref:uncharacterized protein n=1 Tax=Kickxella alabastrina TaxID=61397 RepID=UPI00221F575C|nr:uncharacterized protein BX661DRAFT_180951 [Kickxella alabastrina]KAI7830022.1 hypothetical protein BX661DRAFT_180951 [Kickxella alabastrina]